MDGWKDGWTDGILVNPTWIAWEIAGNHCRFLAKDFSFPKSPVRTSEFSVISDKSVKSQLEWTIITQL